MKTCLLALGAAFAALVAAPGCSRDDPNELLDEEETTTTTTATTSSGGPTGAGGSGSSTDTSSGVGAAGGGTTTGQGGGEECPPTVLDERTLSYTEALRSASFKLVGDAPTLQQMLDLKNAFDQKSVYEAFIDQLLLDPRFAARMVELWKSTFRMGDSPSSPSRDTAPVFAARLVVEGKPYTDLVTATTNTCPTFDASTGVFTDGSCTNTMSGQAVGILTDPGVHALYFGNLAFRRQRFFHETFLCRSALEPVAEPTDMPGAGGPAAYASPWPWTSIAGGAGAQVDFLHDTGVICANCHATWNHRAPLFGMFDANGVEQASYTVLVPAPGIPLAMRSDWLPDAEPTAWRFGMPASTLTELGMQIANDPEVHTCAVARMWNYAMSRGDIVETGNKVSDTVLAPFVTEFVASGFDLRASLRSILVSDDFVRF